MVDHASDLTFFKIGFGVGIDGAWDLNLRNLMQGVYSNNENVSALMDLLFMAKGIERIGDHTKNIAELIIYIVEGVDVRHK